MQPRFIIHKYMQFWHIHKYMLSRLMQEFDALSTYIRVHTSSSANIWEYCIVDLYTNRCVADLYTRKCVIVGLHTRVLHSRLIHKYIRHRRPTYGSIASSTYIRIHASPTNTRVGVSSSAYTREYCIVDLYTSTYVIVGQHMEVLHRQLIDV